MKKSYPTRGANVNAKHIRSTPDMVDKKSFPNKASDLFGVIVLNPLLELAASEKDDDEHSTKKD